MSVRVIHAWNGELYSDACEQVLVRYLQLKETEKAAVRETDAIKEAKQNYYSFHYNMRHIFFPQLTEEIKKNRGLK